MDRLLRLFHDYPAVAGISIFIAISAFLGMTFGSMMLRAGASLKPLVFFFGFMAIIAVPQAAVHLLDALVHYRTTKASPASSLAAEPSPQAPALTPVAWDEVFGPDTDPALITDAKRGLGDIVGDAEEARVSFKGSGETALAARFASPEAANAALNRYGAFFQFAQAEGSDEAGWTARRYGGVGDWNHVVTAGNELYAWSGASRESVESRRTSALGPISRSPGVGASKQQVSGRLAQNLPLLFTFVALNLVVAVGWFFKASSWAARVPAVATASVLDKSALQSRLLALGGHDSPIEVKRVSDGDGIEVIWRYADARWFDLMNIHRVQRAHRLVLRLDEASHKVRVREYWSAFDGSAGRNGVRLDWKLNTGIQFFAVEHQRVFGVQLDAEGKPTGEMSQAWSFDLQQLKAPLIEAITQSGWQWQPLVWNAPKALHWLTE